MTNLDSLRHAAVVFKENRDWDGRVDPEAADTLADAVRALTDPTPVDAAWLDARWTGHGGKFRFWDLERRGDAYIVRHADGFALKVRELHVATNATRGDVLRLLWGLGVAVPEPKGGE